MNDNVSATVEFQRTNSGGKKPGEVQRPVTSGDIAKMFAAVSLADGELDVSELEAAE